MVNFQEAYASWREQTFPSGSSCDALDEIHADLALADAWVAETVIPFIQHGVYRPAQVDVVGTPEKIRDRAIQLARGVAPGDEGAHQPDDPYFILGTNESLPSATAALKRRLTSRGGKSTKIPIRLGALHWIDRMIPEEESSPSIRFRARPSTT